MPEVSFVYFPVLRLVDIEFLVHQACWACCRHMPFCATHTFPPFPLTGTH